MLTVECTECNHLATENSIVCRGCFEELQARLKDKEAENKKLNMFKRLACDMYPNRMSVVNGTVEFLAEQTPLKGKDQ